MLTNINNPIHRDRMAQSRRQASILTFETVFKRYDPYKIWIFERKHRCIPYGHTMKCLS